MPGYEVFGKGLMGNAKYIVPGLARGIAILRLFSKDRRVLTGPEMVELLGIPRATVFRLAQTLVHEGLLEKVEHSQAFRLGVGVLSIGFELLSSLDITELGRPILDVLSRETGLSSHLVIRDAEHVVVVHKAMGQSAFASTLQVGTRLPAHATVLGRVMLMGLSKEALQELYPEKALPKFTSQTPLVLEDLLAVLQADRERGYAISRGYFENGVSSIAAPVYGGQGQIVGALNVTLPNRNLSADEIDDFLSQVLKASGNLSQALNAPVGVHA